MFCVNCGKPLNNDFKVCPYCGTSIPNVAMPITSNGFDIRDGVLVKYTGRASHVIVPDGVKTIGKYAFCEEIKNKFTGNEYVEKITLPNSVTKIEQYAFYRCVNLLEIKLSNQITEIEECSFSNCKKLINIVLPNSISKIGRGAFSGCKELSSVILPKGLSIIESNTFSNCENLTYVDIPQTVTKIERDAFIVFPPYYREDKEPMNCPLSKTKIPDSVIELEQSRHVIGECLEGKRIYHDYFGGLNIYSFMINEGTLNNKYLKMRRMHLKRCLHCGGTFNIFGKCKTCGKYKTY